jgi:multidrug efflux pump subunit AcrB
VVFLHGPAKYLFTPLGLAVVFAMLASYAFSRTLTPITIGLLLKSEKHGAEAGNGFFARAFAKFEFGFENMRTAYTEILTGVLKHRFIIPCIAVLILALGSTLFFFVGRDFFPLIDGGQIQLHVRVPAGTRIDKTEAIFQQVEDKIREVIPENERDLIVDNIGLPARSYNYAFGDGTAMGVNDGVILVALKEDHKPTATYIKKLRQALPTEFPENIFYFQAADMVTQILNFGIPAQINVRTVGYNRANNLRIANELQQKIAAIPGLADVHLQQEINGPEFFAQIDRARASQFGLTVNDIALNLNTSLASSEQVSPNFWTDPANGTPYYLAVQTPEYRTDTFNALKNTPVTKFTAGNNGNPVPGLLSNVATLKRDSIATNTNQANVQPLYEIYANADGRDLGSLQTEIQKVIDQYKPQLTPGNRIEVVGQIDSMNSAFRDLGIGILFAAVFVYLLMVVNYQTWGDPFVVILALPATFCGIVTMLYITNTTLSVPSLMGAIMAIGVASANSILLVTFAREQQLAGHTAFEAAIATGRTRIRPVLMTATAMIVGMIPMAIGGPGEEQNAALARAVIGGLLFATPTTLFVVPYLFALLRKGNDGKPAQGVFAEDPV